MEGGTVVCKWCGREVTEPYDHGLDRGLMSVAVWANESEHADRGIDYYVCSDRCARRVASMLAESGVQETPQIIPVVVLPSWMER